jgi:hypothetical protein
MMHNFLQHLLAETKLEKSEYFLGIRQISYPQNCENPYKQLAREKTKKLL